MKNKIIIFFLLIFSSFYLFGQRIHLEKEYQDIFAKKFNVETEVTLEDGTRVDILTNEYAIEADFANKWAEGIGQSLHYSVLTGKKPAILLIIEDFTNDKKYLKRLELVATKYNIKVWAIDKDFTIYEIDYEKF